MHRRSGRTKKALKAPNLPKRGLGQWHAGASFQAQERYTQLALDYVDLSGVDASHISLDQLICNQVKLDNSQLKRVQILDSQLRVCSLTNAAWNEATFYRVEVLNSHLTGFCAIEALLQDVLFQHCPGAFAQFRFAKLRSVRFEHCDLSEADFHNADLKDVVFEDCSLTGAEFSAATLANVDLRSSKIDGMRAGPRELRGATLDPEQALAFVRGIGIEVKLPHEE